MNIFEKQVSVDGIETGVWVQPDYPNGPKAGEPMVNEKGLPLRLRVRSTASQAYRDLERQRQRKNVGTMVSGTGAKAKRALVNDTTKDKSAEDFSVLVTGFENIEQDGVTTPSPDDLLAFCADNKGDAKNPNWVVRTGMVWLVKLVKDFADDDANYPADAGNDAADSKSA